MPIARRFGPMGFMDLKRRRTRAAELVEATGVVLASTQQSPTELSGGNQQKRCWLALSPPIPGC